MPLRKDQVRSPRRGPEFPLPLCTKAGDRRETSKRGEELRELVKSEEAAGEEEGGYSLLGQLAPLCSRRAGVNARVVCVVVVVCIMFIWGFSTKQRVLYTQTKTPIAKTDRRVCQKWWRINTNSTGLNVGSRRAFRSDKCSALRRCTDTNNMYGMFSDNLYV